MVDSESRGLGSRPCRVCSTAKQCTLKVPLSTKEGKWESTGELSRERDEMLRGGGGRERREGSPASHPWEVNILLVASRKLE